MVSHPKYCGALPIHPSITRVTQPVQRDPACLKPSAQLAPNPTINLPHPQSLPSIYPTHRPTIGHQSHSTPKSNASRHCVAENLHFSTYLASFLWLVGGFKKWRCLFDVQKINCMIQRQIVCFKGRLHEIGCMIKEVQVLNSTSKRFGTHWDQNSLLEPTGVVPTFPIPIFEV